MNMLARRLLLGASATAVIMSVAATRSYAQSAAELAIEEVNVSSSRISLQGFESPTPVQVVGIERIELNARTQLSDEIRDLPQVRGTVGSRSGTARVGQGDGGIDSLNIRGFGAARNLVLFDRQRMVASTIQDSIVDLGTVPSALVQRVDVVTGGASAAWGSDAVTGVVNLVINKNFTGFKANVQYSDASPVALPRYHLDAAWGTPFDGGKGHFSIAGTWNVSNTPNFTGQDPKRNGRASVYNPAYCNAVTYPAATPTSNGTCASPSGAPFLQYIFNAGTNDRTIGGLINSNTAGTAGSGLTSTTALKGIMFAGQNGDPTPFNYGTTYNGTTCYNGCSNNQYTAPNTVFGLTEAPYHSANYFSYGSYQILPDVKASVQLAYGRYVQRNRGTLLSSPNQIFYADNPYLDASLQRRFTCANAASPTCVTTLSNGYNPNTGTGGTAARPTQTITVGMDFAQNRLQYNPTNTFGNTLPGQSANTNVWTMANMCSALGDSCNSSNRTLSRGSFQLDGSLGDAWAWSSYIAWSQMRLSQKVPNDLIRPRLQYALDAVRVSTTNVGASGLPIGSIQCRALLTPANLAADPHLAGCQPINAFGAGSVTNEAYRYVSPGIDYRGTGILEQEVVKMNQTAAALTLNGVLPWQLPAGEVGVALGAEWRLEQSGQYEADPVGIANLFNTGNFYNFSSQQHVEEGFLELAIPLLKDTIVQNFDLNLSGRMTNYSTSGLVETWKIGISTQLTDDFRIRGFISQDIRAPNNFDLFAPGGGVSQTCANWVAGIGTNFCSSFAGGNINLKPEKANTVALGVVFTPTFIPGLTASIDWYDLRLHGGINSVPFNTVIARAKAGEAQYCAAILTSNGTNICNYSQAAGTSGVPLITGVITGPINVGRYSVAGFDTSVDYRFDFWNGEASVGFAGSYTYDFSRLLNGIYFQGAGSTGGYYSGGVKFNGQINLGYRTGPWNFGLQVHMTGDGDQDFGTQGRAGLVDSLSLVRYTRVNGVDVPSVPGGGQGGEGYLPTNYQSWYGDLGGRVQYSVTDNIQLYAAMDRVFPGNKTYRMGVRLNY